MVAVRSDSCRVRDCPGLKLSRGRERVVELRSPQLLNRDRIELSLLGDFYLLFRG